MVVTKRTKTAAKKKCNKCAVEYRIDTGFYKIAQTDANFPDDYVNVCRTCMREEWEDEHSGFDNFLEFLRVANLPYKKDLYNNSKDKPNYIRSLRNKAYMNLRHKDSDPMVEEKGEIQVRTNNLKELNAEQMEECALFWGKGYNEEEYIYMMSQYEKYTRNYVVDSPVMEDLVAKIIQTDLKIRRANEKGQDASKEIKSYQELLNSAHLKPSQEKAAAENEANTFGTFIKNIEDNEPIAAPLPQFQDVDGLSKFIRAFFTAPMANSIGVENPYPEEYKEAMEELSISLEESEGDS